MAGHWCDFNQLSLIKSITYLIISLISKLSNIAQCFYTSIFGYQYERRQKLTRRFSMSETRNWPSQTRVYCISNKSNCSRRGLYIDECISYLCRVSISRIVYGVKLLHLGTFEDRFWIFLDAYTIHNGCINTCLIRELSCFLRIIVSWSIQYLKWTKFW